jgi:hypothetical protein
VDFVHGHGLGSGSAGGSDRIVTMKLLALNLLLLVALRQPAEPPPPLLAQALKSNLAIRLLAPGTDLKEYSQDQLQKFGYWPPWLVQDFDRDKRPDVAAVVVQPSKSGSQYGIIAVHARTPGEIHWIVPLDLEPINGVAKGPGGDTVVPLFCVECDANTWLRWSGEEYETELYAVGDKIDIGTETQSDLPLYTSANLASKPTALVAHCTTVIVRKVGGTPDLRWYFVETPEGQRGWIPDRLISADICIG